MILKSIRKKLYNRFLPKLMEKNYMSPIPRSGEAAKKVNCYSIMLDQESQLYFLAEEYKNYSLIGNTWGGQKYEKPRK